jgi:hypothetical protein
MEKTIETLKAEIANIKADKNQTPHHSTAVANLESAIERLSLTLPGETPAAN